MTPHDSPPLCARKNENEQFVLIEWGKFQSMGETFEILASDVEKLVIFQ
jgi:hypothetical protein